MRKGTKLEEGFRQKESVFDMLGKSRDTPSPKKRKGKSAHPARLGKVFHTARERKKKKREERRRSHLRYEKTDATSAGQKGEKKGQGSGHHPCRRKKKKGRLMFQTP